MLKTLEDNFGNKLYITLKPEILKELVETARNKTQSYVELARLCNCHSTQFCSYRRGIKRATNYKMISKLVKIGNYSIKKEDILGIIRTCRGYDLKGNLIFMEKPWKIFDEWDHYLLGCLASDGYVGKGNFYFRQTIKDVEFSALQIFTLYNLVKKIHSKKIHFYIYPDSSKRFGGVQNRMIFSSILLEIFFNKILDLRFDTDYNAPSWFSYDNSNIYAWLAGLTDGDGYIVNNYNKKWNYDRWNWRLFNGNINPFYAIKDLLEKIYNIQINSRPRLDTKNKYIFSLGSMEILSKFLPKILPYIVIRRKRERIIQAIDHLNKKGFDIKIPENQRTTRNPIMGEVVRFLKERNLIEKLVNWEELESYGKNL